MFHLEDCFLGLSSEFVIEGLQFIERI